jgi:hypothetical protein
MYQLLDEISDTIISKHSRYIIFRYYKDEVVEVWFADNEYDIEAKVEELKEKPGRVECHERRQRSIYYRI